MGEKSGKPFSFLFKDRHAALCAEYLEHFKRLGFQATLLEKESPEQISHSIWEFVPGKRVCSIKIEGKNFQQFVLWEIATKGGPVYYQYFVVRASVSENEEDLNARVSRPLFRSRGSKELTWKGGLVAESLNSDLNLCEWLKSLPISIHVIAKKRNQYVSIEIRTYASRDSLPTLQLLDIIDRIAYHIRRMAPPSL